jgi:hypothetical protein
MKTQDHLPRSTPPASKTPRRSHTTPNENALHQEKQAKVSKGSPRLGKGVAKAKNLVLGAEKQLNVKQSRTLLSLDRSRRKTMLLTKTKGKKSEMLKRSILWSTLKIYSGTIPMKIRDRYESEQNLVSSGFVKDQFMALTMNA